jgi:hypothetical protein
VLEVSIIIIENISQNNQDLNARDKEDNKKKMAKASKCSNELTQ